ncbi:hypothetical protein FZEAL_539 [Fusarium zealandicum]|uniref:Uncharacterized protein n=1 Tax=Fusarium zealandicum TaxID=1053134 RepID=A0A8H4UV01_9HYPO|nr:hypothetical protein FZEAL_539 [Fusarium zealandicum]
MSAAPHQTTESLRQSRLATRSAHRRALAAFYDINSGFQTVCGFSDRSHANEALPIPVWDGRQLRGLMNDPFELGPLSTAQWAGSVHQEIIFDCEDSLDLAGHDIRLAYMTVNAVFDLSPFAARVQKAIRIEVRGHILTRFRVYSLAVYRFLVCCVDSIASGARSTRDAAALDRFVKLICQHLDAGQCFTGNQGRLDIEDQVELEQWFADLDLNM